MTQTHSTPASPGRNSAVDVVLGIDLGTTNSAVAVVLDGVPVLIDVDGAPLLPSVVGRHVDGTLLVGHAARNQYVSHPERTVRSVKRRMGEAVQLSLGGERFTPEEVSAMILHELKAAAEARLGRACDRAVITVPAYFSDAQRTATKRAGEIAGLRVERILNEPTAAALCYAWQRQARAGAEPGQASDTWSESDREAPVEPARTFLVYDLGGGTFDVSLVRIAGDVTEVLASHGDTHLGGDDMDALLGEHVQRAFERAHGVSIDHQLTARARLDRAVEEAKIRLSQDSFCRVREEHLCHRDGVGLHLDLEVTRPEYEDLIEPLIARTEACLREVLRDADLGFDAIDDVLLVGGASHTPLVGERLRALSGRAPRRDVDPERAVALGAALCAGRAAGADVRGVLIDVTSFSFGTSCMGVVDGEVSPHCYAPVIHRNAPIPCRQSQTFYTLVPGQEAINVRIYQGEDRDARRNLLVGRFRVEGLDRRAPANSPIVFSLELSLDGILQVSVLEKHTGLAHRVTMKTSPTDVPAAGVPLAGGPGAPEEPALAEGRGPVDLARARERVAGALGLPDREVASEAEPTLPVPDDLPAVQREAWTKAGGLLDDAARLLGELTGTDRDEVEEVMRRLRAAMRARDWAALGTANDELGDILFYLAG